MVDAEIVNNEDIYPVEGEDIGDAAPGELAEDKKSKRASRVKNPADPTQQVQETSKKKKKKKKGRKLKLISIIVLVLLVAGFVFEEVVYNILGTRDMFIDAVVRIDPEYRAREAKLDAREAKINEDNAELDVRERRVSSAESQADRRSAQLDAREKTISEREQLFDPLYRRKMTAQELEDMQALSLAYSRMAPDDAAVIMVEMNQADDVAAILYYMAPRSSAAILAAMEPEYAALVTEILLYK